MKREAFHTILEALKPYTKYLYFHLMGEPLLHPELATFLADAGKENFFVNLTTNGTLLLKNKEALLGASALRQINISIHSFEANEGGLSLEEYIRDILFLVEEAKKSQVICSLRLWNLDSKDYKGSHSLNEKILKIIEDEMGLTYNLRTCLQKEGSIKIDDRIYLNTSERFEWATRNTKPTCENKFCYGLRDHIGILVDGTVVPCCLDNDGNIPLGNIFEAPLEAILNTKRAQAIYKGFSNRQAVEALCKKCGFRPL